MIACDVLKDVPNDLEAMRELQRILSPDGVAVLTVPQADHLTEKVELSAGRLGHGSVAIGWPRGSPEDIWL